MADAEFLTRIMMYLIQNLSNISNPLITPTFGGLLKVKLSAESDFAMKPLVTFTNHMAMFQNRGYATAMLKAVIEIARKQNRSHLLVTCNVANIASRRVLEKNGDSLRDVYDGDFYRFDFELN
mgnify:CR=1 FL=1